ncbi:MAG: hypothetical protein J5992_03690 [Oscillospiraceae bacterium]|nr:hypothetical protein [Oscillospiraceae bacterium]
MANWCFTTMCFHGNAEELTDLYNKIHEWTKMNEENSERKDRWLGNIIQGAGLNDDLYRCRGFVDCIYDLEITDPSDDMGAVFYMSSETAWGPLCSFWPDVIEKMGYKTIGFSYIAEESNMGVFVIYDNYGDFSIVHDIDIWVEGEDKNNPILMELSENHEFESDEDIKAILQKLLKTDEDDLNTLIYQAENYDFEDEDSFLSVHTYTRVDEP